MQVRPRGLGCRSGRTAGIVAAAAAAGACLLAVPASSGVYETCVVPHVPREGYPENFCRVVQYRVRLNGGGERQRVAVINPPRTRVLLSPRGDRILYGPVMANENDLVVARPDGSEPVRLNADGIRPAWQIDGDHIAAAFSPDGRWVAFTGYSPCSGVACARFHVYVVRVDGTGRRRLAPGMNPTWAPDGKWLAYAADFYGDNRDARSIYLIRRDGTGRRRLGRGAWPIFAPRGNLILHNCERQWVGACLSSTDGKLRRKLPGRSIPVEGTELGPWSADGRRFAYRTQDQLYVAAIERGRVVSRVVAKGRYWPAAWSPDGKELVVARSTAPDTVQLFRRSAAPGGRMHQLTTEPPHTHLGNVRWNAKNGSITFHAYTYRTAS